MISATEQTVLLDVTCPTVQPAQTLISRLLRSGLSSVTLLRGRVTSSEARFRVELKGTIRSIKAALQQNQRDGIRLARSGSVPA
jgi:hypothetical protein